jgi:hypothetical protein
MQPQGNGTNDNPATEILAKVKLQSFTATPSHIVPFQSSVLAWTVPGPADGFIVDIDGSEVPATGKMTVSPIATHEYSMTAHAGTITTDLGAASVVVDTSACYRTTTPMKDSDNYILQTLVVGILEGDDTLYITPPEVNAGTGGERSNVPTLSFQPGRMIFDFYLSKRIADEPDPALHVHLECGLQIDPADGTLQTANPSLNVNVSEPLWLYLVPIIGPYAEIKAALSQPAIEQKFQPLFGSILSLVEAVYSIDNSNSRYLTVSIPGGNADPSIQFVVCPFPV